MLYNKSVRNTDLIKINFIYDFERKVKSSQQNILVKFKHFLLFRNSQN